MTSEVMIRQRAADKMSSCDRREESKTISCLTGNKRRDQVLCSFLFFWGFLMEKEAWLV